MLTQTALQQAPYTDTRPVVAPSMRRERPPYREVVSAAKEPAGMTMSFARNTEIFAEGEPSGTIYKVVSGAVRVYKILSDGRRQISAFHLPGDMFGLEPDDQHHFSAEAIVPTKVTAYKASSLFAGGARNDGLRGELWDVAMKSLARSQEHLLLLGRKSALERVAAFLLEMVGRGEGNTALDLPMPRHDIADYLGLTLETVSRMLAELKAMAAIRLPSARHVELTDMAALRNMSA